MTPRRLVLAVVLALLLGALVGYLWHRGRAPSVSERARDAAQQLGGAVKRMTK